MCLKKVISGGQTGADFAGLVSAKKAGLETGGWMPKGFKNETGFCPELADKYGIQEHTSEKYPPRTYANARNSDGTVRFADDFNSRGEICTLKAIKQYERPYIDIDVNNPLPKSEVVKWIIDNKIKTLNIAGNRESTSPGICEFVTNYLSEVFKDVVSYS